MTKEQIVELIEEVTIEICGCVDNCGNCKFYDPEINQCVLDEYVEHKLNAK